MRYDFACQVCGHRFEYEKRMNAPSPTCPSCGGTTERFFGAGNVPAMMYGNRPPWTYNDTKAARKVSDGKTSYEVDGTHGSISSMHVTPPKAKRKKGK